MGIIDKNNGGRKSKLTASKEIIQDRNVNAVQTRIAKILEGNRRWTYSSNRRYVKGRREKISRTDKLNYQNNLKRATNV